tara:strand:+ start:6165 stop:6281 length:117 start_codon:yes stop_codon:yes gene_type:complete
MGYGLGSDDPAEISFYEMIKKENKKDRENRNMGIVRID